MREYLKFYIDGAVDRSGAVGDLRGHQPGHRGGRGHRGARLRRGRRQGGRSRPARLSRLVRRRAASSDWACSATSSTSTRQRMGDLACRTDRGDGRSEGAGGWLPGEPGTRAPDHRDRRTRALHVRGTAWRHPDREGADRRLRPDHAVELAAQPDRGEGVPRLGHRLHHGAQAVGAVALQRTDLRRDPARSGCPRGRVQPGPG